MSRPKATLLVMLLTAIVAFFLRPRPLHAQPAAEVTFSPPAATVACYDFAEVKIDVQKPTAKNPFTDVTIAGEFGPQGQNRQKHVDGFCDSADGSVFRIRFMPDKPGDYTFSITCNQGTAQAKYSGSFKAIDAKRRGILRVDPEHPWHFMWEGTGEHCFVNGTTAFLLMGWEDERVIKGCIDRFSALEVNRIRVLLDGRSDHFWTEPIKPGKGFEAHLNPWVAQRPDDVSNPGFDYTRFNCPYWRKFERMLAYAREKNIVISVIFAWNDTAVHPAAGSDDEHRYFHYAAARLGAYSNVTWDLGDDLNSFRDAAWTHETGTLLEKWDAYHHLATSHPTDNSLQDRTAPWFGMTSFQQWQRPLHQWMLDQRAQQTKTGRIIPQMDEEYGYEDHYPSWAPYKAPAASADADRRAAWEISMAGCYQSTGETAKRGTGVPPDTGGGWVNGRGDKTMTMLQGYAHMVDFFKSIPWWKADPHDELVDHEAFCLAEPNEFYVIYLPRGGAVTLHGFNGRYAGKWFNPRTGESTPVPAAQGPSWTSPAAADQQDWVLLLEKQAAAK